MFPRTQQRPPLGDGRCFVRITWTVSTGPSWRGGWSCRPGPRPPGRRSACPALRGACGGRAWRRPGASLLRPGSRRGGRRGPGAACRPWSGPGGRGVGWGRWRRSVGGRWWLVARRCGCRAGTGGGWPGLLASRGRAWGFQRPLLLRASLPRRAWTPRWASVLRQAWAFQQPSVPRASCLRALLRRWLSGFPCSWRPGLPASRRRSPWWRRRVGWRPRSARRPW